MKLKDGHAFQFPDVHPHWSSWAILSHINESCSAPNCITYNPQHSFINASRCIYQGPAGYQCGLRLHAEHRALLRQADHHEKRQIKTSRFCRWFRRIWSWWRHHLECFWAAKTPLGVWPWLKWPRPVLPVSFTDICHPATTGELPCPIYGCRKPAKRQVAD